MNASSFTVATAAMLAAVGVETVRYYERRGLIAQPERKTSGYRTYDSKHVARIRFIKRAQELGFSLEEIEDLLALEDGRDRRSIRGIATQRLREIRARLADLARMEKALTHLLHDCEGNEKTLHCPIIAAIAQDSAERSTLSNPCSGAHFAISIRVTT
jgi:Hg(II)-responsive transcriptional regulator